MSTIIEKIKKAAPNLDEAALKLIQMDVIEITSGAVHQVADYVKRKGYKKVIITVDEHTYHAAGQLIEAECGEAGIAAHVTSILPNAQGDVIADEVSIIQLLLDIQQTSADAVIAAGSGTLHDITRYACYTAGLPFISVPTAPSVDGFNSKGAPIIIRGEKKTIQSIGPDAIFADLDILTKAPVAMVAAGFGDMLGKYTSLFDWKFGSLVAGEPYDQAVADITRQALEQCVDQVDSIAKRDEEGIQTLISALIESGMAMLILGQSHPASGAEHHLSHFWEMEYISLGKKQLLHGAKVGVACVQIAGLYHRLAQIGPPVDATFRGSIMDGAEENLTLQEQHRQAIVDHWEEISEAIAQIPGSHVLEGLLKKVGGPTSTEELGVNSNLLQRSLQEAHNVRMNRYTLLRARNELLQ